MNIEDVIKQEILSQYKSVRSFTQAVNIPYSTIDSMLKKGVRGTAVQTVIKVCDSLGLDLNVISHAILYGSEGKDGQVAKFMQKLSSKLGEFSDEVLEVAKAYENAELKNKNIARQALDLPLLPEQSHPYMLRVAARGQGVFDVPLEHPLTEEDFEKLEEAAAKTMEDYGDL